MKHHPNIEMLETVTMALGDFCDEVVFVGGAVTAFYITDPAATEIRPTNDVDCVSAVQSRQNYHAIESKLRTLGFKNHMDGPLCRWDYKGITVDVMTTDQSITGFTNQWYADGIRHRIKSKLPSGKEINVLTLPFFIATKFEAFNGRGKKDYRTSHDIEDIVTVLDGSVDDDLFSSAPEDLKKYLQKEFSKFLKSVQFEESLYGHISRTGNDQGRVERIKAMIRKHTREE